MLIKHTDINDLALHSKIRSAEVLLAGNSLLKIYGTLHCKSGKRMKKVNRVFFSSEEEATNNGYRPCGHCMKQAYTQWKEFNASQS
jgi:methylphosphotriester-DNA--protein-cysteine methyltransferase